MLSNDEGPRLAALAAMLSEGLLSEEDPISDDERVTAIVCSLTSPFHLTYQNIARLTGVDIEALENFMAEPTSIPVERKYQLAVRVSYLANAITQAQRH